MRTTFLQRGEDASSSVLKSISTPLSVLPQVPEREFQLYRQRTQEPLLQKDLYPFFPIFPHASFQPKRDRLFRSSLLFL